MSEKLGEAQELLRSIITDHSVPKNIRRAAKQANEGLENSEDPPTVRANLAISVLDEISQDPNCPVYSRTKIWQIVSILETVNDN
ncbi:MAG: UPF0147 family protein [Candidatus Hodarchaeales archaeon]|jgi:uncharacterized protein (UPF0147 family)